MTAGARHATPRQRSTLGLPLRGASCDSLIWTTACSRGLAAIRGRFGVKSGRHSSPWKHCGGKRQALAVGEGNVLGRARPRLRTNRIGEESAGKIFRTTGFNEKRRHRKRRRHWKSKIGAQATAAVSTPTPISCARSASITRMFTGTWRWALARG